VQHLSGWPGSASRGSLHYIAQHHFTNEQRRNVLIELCRPILTGEAEAASALEISHRLALATAAVVLCLNQTRDVLGLSAVNDADARDALFAHEAIRRGLVTTADLAS
jgi:hypothetical protein